MDATVLDRGRWRFRTWRNWPTVLPRLIRLLEECTLLSTMALKVAVCPNSSIYEYVECRQFVCAVTVNLTVCTNVYNFIGMPYVCIYLCNVKTCAFAMLFGLAL